MLNANSSTKSKFCEEHLKVNLPDSNYPYINKLASEKYAEYILTVIYCKIIICYIKQQFSLRIKVHTYKILQPKQSLDE